MKPPKIAEPKKPASTLEARREQMRSERRRDDLKWHVMLLGTLGVMAVLIVLYIVGNIRPGPLPGEVLVPSEGAGQLPVGSDLLPYQNEPPSSGQHYNVGLPWGLASEPAEPGYYLNNLARGGVVYLYACDTKAVCTTLANQFADLIKSANPDRTYNRVKIVAARYDQPLPAPIVALAWEHQLNLQTFDEATLLQWYNRFVNYGPRNGP